MSQEFDVKHKEREINLTPEQLTDKRIDLLNETVNDILNVLEKIHNIFELHSLRLDRFNQRLEKLEAMLESKTSTLPENE